APPNLMTVTRNGERIDAAAQITKSGHVFLFDRENGEPLFPIVEQPVSPSTLQGEEAWPTQPFPIKPEPFARQFMSANDLNHLSDDYDELLARFMSLRSGGQYEPPSIEGTIMFPGFDGGGEWGGAAHDPNTGILYVNSNEMPWVLTMVELDGSETLTGRRGGAQLYTISCASCHGLDLRGDDAGIYPSLVGIDERMARDSVRQVIEKGRGIMPSFGHIPDNEVNSIVAFLFGEEVFGSDAAPVDVRADEGEESIPVQYAHTGYHRFVDSKGYPAVKPPWGTLNAIDMNAGKIVWKVPLGEDPELTARGVPQ